MIRIDRLAGAISSAFDSLLRTESSESFPSAGLADLSRSDSVSENTGGVVFLLRPGRRRSSAMRICSSRGFGLWDVQNSESHAIRYTPGAASIDKIQRIDSIKTLAKRSGSMCQPEDLTCGWSTLRDFSSISAGFVYELARDGVGVWGGDTRAEMMFREFIVEPCGDAEERSTFVVELCTSLTVTRCQPRDTVRLWGSVYFYCRIYMQLIGNYGWLHPLCRNRISAFPSSSTFISLKMPVELRKRKAPEPVPAPPPKKSTVSKAVAKVKEAVKPNGAAKKVAVGDTVTLDAFGGEVETNDGEKTTLKKLVDESKAGVVLFTYPKASTPGCTCFRL